MASSQPHRCPHLSHMATTTADRNTQRPTPPTPTGPQACRCKCHTDAHTPATSMTTRWPLGQPQRPIESQERLHRRPIGTSRVPVQAPHGGLRWPHRCPHGCPYRAHRPSWWIGGLLNQPLEHFLVQRARPDEGAAGSRDDEHRRAVDPQLMRRARLGAKASRAMLQSAGSGSRPAAPRISAGRGSLAMSRRCTTSDPAARAA